MPSSPVCWLRASHVPPPDLSVLELLDEALLPLLPNDVLIQHPRQVDNVIIHQIKFLPDGDDVEGRCQRDINGGDLFIVDKHFVGFNSVLPSNDIVMGPLCQTNRPKAGIPERHLQIFFSRLLSIPLYTSLSGGAWCKNL